MKYSKNHKTNRKINGRKLLYFLILVTTFSQTYAQLVMKKHTINNGGAAMSGGGFELKGSIGQVDAAPPASEGHGISNYSLSSGFWQENTDLIFKDNLE